jgi:hypothetical protein
MRKILLAATTLAAFAGFSSAANAQITVSLGGYTEFFGAIYDNSLINGTDREFQLETEIVVRADGKADNGLLYGTKVELQNGAGTGMSTDEASVYVAGFWGRVEMGDFDGAADALAIYAPLVGVEGIDGDYADFISTNNVTFAGKTGTFELGRQPWGGGGVKAPDSSDSTKIMYLTPRFAGVQAGFSYTPENGDEAQNVVGLKNTSGYSDFLEYGINYTGEFSGVTVAASATGTSGNGKGDNRSTSTSNTIINGVTSTITTNTGSVALKDFSAWQIGAQVGYAGFKIGGGYVDAENFNVPVRTDSGDQHAWNAGISYTMGPATVGLSYLEAEGFKRTPGTYAEQYQAYGVSGAYTLAPGLLLQSDLMYVEEDLQRTATSTLATDKVNVDGYVWLISTRVNF